MFVIDLRKIIGFLRVFLFSQSERSEITEILEEMTFNAYTIHLTLTYTYVQLVYTKQHQRNLQ